MSNKKQARTITIDHDPTSESTVCPRCLSSIINSLSLWEAAEKGCHVMGIDRHCCYYECKSCGCIWHEDS